MAITTTATTTSKTTGINLGVGSLLGIILICVGLSFGAYTFGSIGKTNADTKYAASMAKYQKSVLIPAIKKADSIALSAKKDSIRADSLNKKSIMQSKEINRLNNVVVGMDNANKPLFSKIQNLPDTCKFAVLLASDLKIELDTLKAVNDSLASDTTTLKNETVNLRSESSHWSNSFHILEDSVKKMPKYVPPAKLFNLKFLPQVTPEQAFIGGGVIGIIITAFAHKL